MDLEIFNTFKDENILRLAGISHDNMSNGPGIRSVLFTQGCHHRCKGCHNSTTWSCSSGKVLTIDKVKEELQSNPHFGKLTISGGEPVLQYLALNNLLKKMNLIKPVWMWTGYTPEELLILNSELPNMQDFLSKISYVVTGRFELELKDPLLHWRGSSNQRIQEVILKPELQLKDVSDHF